MADDCTDIEEHELPSTEAVIACTLALMTGYSQALQAELHPGQRLAMGEKITGHLRLLSDHPRLSLGFRQVLLGLQSRWEAMGACTREAAHGGEAFARDVGGAAEGVSPGRPPWPKRLH